MTETRLTGDDEQMPVAIPDAGVLTAISRAELDQQITTARAYPRSLKRFRDEALSMATLDEDVADSCLYSVPRAGKTIDGPSVRLAEIITSAWGNCHAGARVVDVGAEFITAQGVFFDLQRNVKITMEVQRRITDKKGRRYSDDMIQTTGNAACSIALRNAVFRAIPKAFWNGIYHAARKAAIGDGETLIKKRDQAFSWFLKAGITPDRVLARIEKPSVEDVDFDGIATLRGIMNAMRDNEISPDDAFPALDAKPKTEQAKGVQGLKGRVAAKKAANPDDEYADIPPQEPDPEREAIQNEGDDQ